MPRSSKPKVTVDASGFVVLNKALAKVPKEIRTEQNGAFRTAAKQVASSVVIPQLHLAAASSGRPLAKRLAATARPQSDRWPKVAVGGKGNFREPRSKRDAPRVGAVLWGTGRNPYNNPRYGAGAGDRWIGPAVRDAGPRALAIHQRHLTQTLFSLGLL